MGYVGNPNPWITNDNFKDCSQGICSIDCPQFCYLIFPPPPPPDDESGGAFSPLIIAVIGVLATGLLLVSYYIILSRYCRRRREQSIVLETGEIRGERDRDRWQIPSDGLDESLIRNIRVFKYQKSGGVSESSDHCAVCLSEFQENESLRLLPKCSHAFHLPCIDMWLKSHSNCPLCRGDVVVVAMPSEQGTPATTELNASDSALVVDDDGRSCEQVVVNVENDREMVDEEFVGYRRSVSLGSFSCQRHLLISDILKFEEIDEDLGFRSGKIRIGSSNGADLGETESGSVDWNRSIAAGEVCVPGS